MSRRIGQQKLPPARGLHAIGVGFRLGTSVASRRLQPTMLRLRPRRREVLVETLRELANLTAGALVLAQFIGQQTLSLGLAVAGIALWLALVGMAVALAEESNDE
jgi:hypothetical protein